jgi:hypothetical protein
MTACDAHVNASRDRALRAEKAHHVLTVLCRCLGVTRGGFDGSQGRSEAERSGISS